MLLLIPPRRSTLLQPRPLWTASGEHGEGVKDVLVAEYNAEAAIHGLSPRQKWHVDGMSGP